jgi:hypothetical protein
MATDTRIVHTYNCSESTFWDELFLDEEYNRRLYLEALRFHAWKVVKNETVGDEVHRDIEVVPRLGDMPGPMKKVLGDNLKYREEGVFNKAERRYSLRIIPSTLADKTQVTGIMHTEPIDDKSCRRVFEVTVAVKIFGLGGMMEKHLIGDITKSYAVGAKFTNAFLAETRSGS